MEDEEKPRGISYRRILDMLGPSLKQMRWYFLAFFFLAIVMGVAAVAEPYIYGSIIDRLVQGVQQAHSPADVFKTIIPFLLAWIGVVVVSTTVGAGYTFLRWYVGNDVGNRFSYELFRRILVLDMRLFRDQKGGEIVRRFSNAWDSFFNLHEMVMRDYLPASIMFVLGIAIGWYLDPRLMIVALVPVPLIFAIGLYQMKRTEPLQISTHALWDEANAVVGDVFTNIATVKSFVGEGRVFRLYRAVAEKAKNTQHDVNKRWAISDALYGGIFVLGRLAVFYFGVTYILAGTSTVGTLIIFLGLLSFLFGAVERITGSWLGTAREIGRLDRATDYWFDVPVIRDAPKAKALTRSKGEIVFDDVSYAYEEGKQILHNINVTIPAGQTVALVGESGGGKSTLAQLVLRFQDPTHGRVLIDGGDIKLYQLQSLRKQIGFVMQEHVLFHDSIYKNILFGKPNASKQEVIAAAKRAQAHTFISRLPKGYDAMVGERGVKLSGGEKQRIALARVFLANPPILVLDEATSALDSKTEHELQVALAEVMKGRTTLVIAHRLSTIMQAHQILVINKGHIVDQGTHEELIKRQGLYQEFWNIQAGGYV